MDALEKAKEIIQSNIVNAAFGIFDERNLVGDEMHTLYVDDVIQIDICYVWGYFEVFGLTSSQFKELEEFYEKVNGGRVMDALEFAREIKRMCDSYDNCERCELFRGGAATDYCNVEEIENAVPIVEKWSKEHPFVRNVDHVAEGLEKLGYAVDKEYLSKTCPTAYSTLFAKGRCPNKYNCDECRKWWLEEYTGEDINVLGKGE